MYVARRSVVFSTIVALSAIAFGSVRVRADNPPQGAKKMYGTIGKIVAVEGKRDELIAILLHGTGEMPGCLSYIVAKDLADPAAIWITEVWEDPASHKASLSLPAVREAIAKGKPLIAKFDRSVITEPVGGHGLPVKGR